MKPVTRFLILSMILMLLMPASLALQAEPAAENAAQSQAPEGFEYLKAAQKNISKYHTAIRVPGFDHTVYAYLDRSGGVTYLV